MVTLGLLVRLEAKPGKGKQIEEFLKGAIKMAREEDETMDWFALKMGPTTFGIFDTFEDEEGRQAHLAGDIAKALLSRAPDLFSTAPVIEQVELLAVK